MKIDRLLAIVILLLNHKRMSGEELAAHFEVAVRTIYRDIEAINQAGIPIVSYQGKTGGFGILESYRIDKNVFSKDDLASIISALKGLNAAFSDKKIDATIEKMNSLLSGTANSKGKNYIFFELTPGGGDEFEINKLKTIKQAIEGSKLLSIEYRDNAGSLTQRTIEPMAIISHGHTWYVYAFCRKRQDYRVFKLSRIKNVEMQQEVFYPKDVDLDAKPWNVMWGDNGRWLDLTLKFKPDSKHKALDYFQKNRVEEQPDGSLLVRTGFPEDEWVYGFILSFGESAEVIEPVSVRELIAEKARKIWENNKSKQ